MQQSILGELDNLSLEHLRKRRSEKWDTFKQGVLPAFVAEMDFYLAQPIRTALHEAIDNGDCGYATGHDLPAVVAGYVARAFGVEVDSSNVFVMPDIMAGVKQALHVSTPPGSPIVINPPVYGPFYEVIRESGRRVMEVPLWRDHAGVWQLDIAGLDRAFAAGARGYLLCSPHNPVGRVWSADDLQRVAAIAKSHGVAVISDEIFAPLTIPGVTFTSMLKCAHDEQPVVVLLSASKGWNLGGLKCATMLTRSRSYGRLLGKHLSSIPIEVRDRVGHLGVIASIAAYRDGFPWLSEAKRYLATNLQVLKTLLHERLPEAHLSIPEATYLAWIDCSNLGIGPSPARAFLERGKVALSPGEDFGSAGAGFVRLNYATSKAVLTEIVDRMAASVAT